MVKVIFIYLMGLLLVAFFLPDIVIFLNTKILDVTIVSTQENDNFFLLSRAILSFIFGGAYFLFKYQRFGVRPRIIQGIFSTLGLIILLIVIDILQVVITQLFFRDNKITIRIIFALWITFPIIILYYGLPIKYIYRPTSSSVKNSIQNSV